MPGKFNRPLGNLSIDVDPIDLHLLGYGHAGAAPDTLVYTHAIPRLLDLFKKSGTRATFFFIARDLPAQTDAVAKVAAAGHEIASHSLTHPLSLRRLDAAALQHELRESKARLEAASGKPVIGFRAPNWDFDPSLVPALAAAGYLYDASSFPSPYLLGARLLLAKKGSASGAMKLRKWPFSWNRHPHKLEHGGASVLEIPISVDGLLRKPAYHTLRYGMSDAAFIGILDRAEMSAVPISYPLHAIDVLGLTEDGVDSRLAVHPGMGMTLDAKLELLRRTLQVVSSRFPCMPYRDWLAKLAAA